MSSCFRTGFLSSNNVSETHQLPVVSVVSRRKKRMKCFQSAMSSSPLSLSLSFLSGSLLSRTESERKWNIFRFDLRCYIYLRDDECNAKFFFFFHWKEKKQRRLLRDSRENSNDNKSRYSVTNRSPRSFCQLRLPRISRNKELIILEFNSWSLVERAHPICRDSFRYWNTN